MVEKAVSPQEILFLMVKETLNANIALALKTNKYFKCSRCGWCCKIAPATITYNELTKISHYLKITNKRMLKKNCFTTLDGQLKLRSPCPFYIQGKCKIYNIRPLICRTYPFKYGTNLLQAIDKCEKAKAIFDFYKKNLDAVDRMSLAEKQKILDEHFKKTFSPMVNHILNMLGKDMDEKTMEEHLQRVGKAISNPGNLPDEQLDSITVLIHPVFLEWMMDNFLAYELKEEIGRLF